MTSFNYVKGCSSVMRYLNELILKGGVKRVSLLLAISIDFEIATNQESTKNPSHWIKSIGGAQV